MRVWRLNYFFHAIILFCINYFVFDYKIKKKKYFRASSSDFDLNFQIRAHITRCNGKRYRAQLFSKLCPPQTPYIVQALYLYRIHIVTRTPKLPPAAIKKVKSNLKYQLEKKWENKKEEKRRREYWGGGRRIFQTLTTSANIIKNETSKVLENRFCCKIISFLIRGELGIWLEGNRKWTKEETGGNARRQSK